MASVLLSALVAAGSSDPFPLLPIVNATAPWAAPNPALPYPIGPNPGLAWQADPEAVRQPPAPAKKQGLLLGDIRARLHVDEVTAAAGGPVTAQIFWRRRDPNPHLKAVVVTTAAGAQVPRFVVVPPSHLSQSFICPWFPIAPAPLLHHQQCAHFSV